MALRTGKNLYFKTGIDNKGLKRGAAEGKGIIKNFAQQVSGTDVFAGVGISAGLAFGKAASHAKQFATEYETAMKEVQTISDAVQENYEGIKSQLVDMSKTVPDNATALAKAYYQIVSAGYDGAKGMELLSTASKAAVGGISDTLTAADGFTTVLNAWKMEAKDVTKVSDIMFQTVKLGKTTFSEIAGSISNVAALASASGISFKEISGSVATLTKQGVPTAMAFTQIRQAIIALSENLGDGWSKTMTFQEGLVKLRDMAGGSDNKLKELVGRVEGMNAVLSMTGDNAKIAAADLEAMGNSFMASSDAYDVMAESASVKFEIFKNTVSAALLPLGDFLKDNLADAATGFVNALETGKVEKYAKVLGVAAATMVTYKTATALATTSNIQFLRIAVKARQAIRGLNAAMMANPIGMLAAGLAAAATALVLFRKRSMESTEEVKAFYGEMNQEIAVVDGLFSVLENAAEGTDARKQAIERINGKYGEYMEHLLTEKSTLEDIKKANDEARDAAISRIALTAKTAALDEARAEAMNKQGELQAKLYSELSETMGGDAAHIAAENVGALGDKFSELYTEYQKLVSEGGTGKNVWTQLQGEVRSFVDTFSNGEEYNLVWDIAESIYLDQTKLAAKEAEISAHYAGFIQDIQETIDPNPDDSEEPTEDELLGDLEEMLEKARQAYDEWAVFKKTSRAEDLQGDYQQYLDQGKNYKEFLENKVKNFKGSSKDMTVLIKELAKIEAEEIALIEEGAKALSKSLREEGEAAQEELDDLWDDYIDGLEKSIQEDLKKEEEEIARSLDRVKAIKMKYAKNREHLNAELKELEEHYKTARLPLDDEYYQLREKIQNKYIAAEIRAYTDGAQEILGAFTHMLKEIDSEAADSMVKVTQLVGNIGGAVAGFYSGDYASMIANIVGGLTQIWNLVDSAIHKSERELIESRDKSYEALNDKLQYHNDLLQRQIDLNQRLEGMPWMTSMLATAGNINKEMNRTVGLMEAMASGAFGRGTLPAGYSSGGRADGIDTNGWSMDNWRQLIQDATDWDDVQKAQMQGYIDQWMQYETMLLALVDETNQKLTGTTADAISDSLVEVFASGEIAAENFGQKFEDIMKQAVLNSFKARFIEAQMAGFYEMFADMMESPTGTDRGARGLGVLTPEEMAKLREEWDYIIEKAQAGFNAMTGAIGLDFGTGEEEDTGVPEDEAATGLKGAIKGITEDTAGILAGQMGAIRINVARSVQIASANLNYQQQIASNTYQLHAIRNLLENSNAIIDERVNGR